MSGLFLHGLAQLVQRIGRDAGSHFCAVLGTEGAGELEAVEAALGEVAVGEFNAEGEAVVGECGLLHRDRPAVLLAGTVVGFVGIEVGAAAHVDAFCGGGFGEGDVEAGLGEADPFHLEGQGLAVPGDALHTEGGGTDTAPAAAGLSDPEGAVGTKGEADAATLEMLDEVDHRALVDVVHFFEVDAEDVGAGLVTDEHVALERAKLAIGEVEDGVAGAVGDLAVGDPDRGGRAPLAVIRHADLVQVLAREIGMVAQ